MKSKMKIKKTVVESLVCLSIAFSIGSCACHAPRKSFFIISAALIP